MNRYVRKDLATFQNYTVEPLTEKYISNANESPVNIIEKYKEDVMDRLLEDVNRYPDPLATDLRERLAEYVGCSPEEILVGNGADECIKIAIETFCEPTDTIVTTSPTFSMYGLTGKIQGCETIVTQDLENYLQDIDRVIELANTNRAKLIFLCSPNNPTGTLLKQEDLQRVIDQTDSLIVLDEAYVEFAENSLTSMYSDRVIVLRTLSKAFALAGLRVGYAVSGESNILEMRKIKPPYNLNRVSQKLAAFALNKKTEFLKVVEMIKKERQFMFEKLKDMGVEVYPSQANFLLVKAKDPERVRKRLEEYSIKLKDYKGDALLDGYFRISISTGDVNDLILKAFGD